MNLQALKQSEHGVASLLAYRALRSAAERINGKQK